MGALSLRAVLRKESWMFCAGFVSILPISIFGSIAAQGLTASLDAEWSP
jgi:hypothetical protein